MKGPSKTEIAAATTKAMVGLPTVTLFYSPSDNLDRDHEVFVFATQAEAEAFVDEIGGLFHLVISHAFDSVATAAAIAALKEAS